MRPEQNGQQEASSWLGRFKTLIQRLGDVLHRCASSKMLQHHHHHSRFDITKIQHHPDPIERARCWTSLL